MPNAPFVLVSLRRGQTAASVARLAESLARAVGPDRIANLDAIGWSDDTEDQLRLAFEDSRFVMVVVGPRIQEPSAREIDRVRDEAVHRALSAALGNRGTLVLPVLVQGAARPARAQAGIVGDIAARVPVHMRASRWHQDIAKLMAVLASVYPGAVRPPDRGSDGGWIAAAAGRLAWGIAAILFVAISIRR